MKERTTTPPGRFISEWYAAGTVCSHCSRVGTVKYREWESDNGGFLDYQYACSTCGHEWWIDGIDT
jgi:lysyl-tRNA synthetase class I